MAREEVEVTYELPHGERRRGTLTAAEADRLRRETAALPTTTAGRAFQTGRRLGVPLVKWLLIALVGGLIGSEISDHFTDRHRELDLEADLVAQVSESSIVLYQEAQEASRATDSANQRRRRDRAADRWVLASGKITPVFRAYYDGAPPSRHWDAYQAAMYDWAVLGCCTTDRRADLVMRIRRYLETHVGPPTRTPPVSDPWADLSAHAQPAPGLYQWLGLYLLRGRGQLLDDLKADGPDLD